MPLFLTRRDREIIENQERIEQVQREEAEARERERLARVQNKSARELEWEARMRRKEEEFLAPRAETDTPLRDMPRRSFRSNKYSICGDQYSCRCGHNCDGRCDHVYRFGEIDCILCGTMLGEIPRKHICHMPCCDGMISCCGRVDCSAVS